MNRSHLWKLLLVVFVLSWAVYSQIPWKGRSVISVFQERSVRDKRDATYTNILQQAEAIAKANPQRNAYSCLKEAVGTNEVARYFPFINVKSEKEPTTYVLQRLQRLSAGKVKLGLDLQGGTSFLVGMDFDAVGARGTNSDRGSALSHAVEVLRKRVDRLGVAEPIIQPQGEDRILVQLPGLSEAERESARRLIQAAAFLEFRMVHPESQALLQQEIVEPGYEVLIEQRNNRDGTKTINRYLVKKGAEQGLTGKYLKRAMVTRHQVTNEPEIDFELTPEGATIFADITKQFSPKGNKHYQLAIVLDGALYSAPRIMGEIPGGRGQITGSFDVREAFELANVLENPLEAPVKIIQENSVDPSLGSDSIKSGIKAAVIGVVAVAAFMLVYYLMGGVVANVALILNIIILIGVLCSIDATLTLPGIAGIVLTIGMAVDANVLIFERIREESEAGKSLRGALSAGYDKAFSTIFDSNLTTLISSSLLIVMGTGPVKGFGVTLTIGITVSMFTALVVTRLIFDFMLAKNMIRALPMLRLIHNTKFDFMRWAIPAFVASWALIAVGNGYGVFVRGHDVFGVEFSGGEKLVLNFDQKNKVEVDRVRKAVEALGLGGATIQYQREMTGGREALEITTRLASGAEDPGQGGQKVLAALKKDFPQASFSEASRETVGGVIGKQIQKNAIVSALLAMFGILVYVAFRYEFSFAIGAVVAIIHDILMTLGVFFLSGYELSGPVVAALLTIIGFSINDTIVVFDRIREDLRMGKRGSFRDIMNDALNRTLSRTIITSGTVFLATMSLFVFGGGSVKDFAFTFLIGIIVGTYSSIYIASALVLWWHKGERPTLGSSVTMEGAASTAQVHV